jgi:hypothetical protein
MSDEIEQKPVKVMRVSPLSGVAPPRRYCFKPGHEWSGNSLGRPALGLSIAELMNQMGAWKEHDIRSAQKDADAPAAKRIAAGRLLDAMTMERTKAGVPVALSQVDQLMDRTVGRPAQTLFVHRENIHSDEYEQLSKLDVNELRAIANQYDAEQHVLPALPSPQEPAQLPENREV